MKIAIPYENGQVFQHFGHSAQFKLYTAEEGRITGAEVVSTDGQGHGALVGFLVRSGVNVLLCGGIGGGAQMALAQAGIRLCGGITEMSGECGSRTNLEMPDVQRELLAELLKTGKPVVLLNFAGRPTVLTWEKAHVPAIMNVWFGGSEMGDALCDVIFGDKSPSGKLTTSMPKTTGQEPLYYNHQNTGRPVADDNEKFAKFASNCLDVSNGPLYPFGYGLSYTYFSYSNFRLSSQEASISNEEATEWQDDKKITASVTVKNNGSRDADEIVQLYIRDMVASISRPVKELKGFQRIHLAVGESKEVSFDITPDMLKFYNADLKHVIEPGDFQIMIGTNSKDVKTMKLNVK